MNDKKIKRIAVKRAAEEETSEVLVAEEGEADVVNWREVAARLQAEMDNFRKRQRRLAQEQIAVERSRLLLALLAVVDNLEQTLHHIERNDPLHQGVKVALDGMVNLLRAEGVVPIEAVGQPFDPEIHEARAMVPAPPDQEEDMLVIAEELRGYQMDGRLLRPSRAVVAKKLS